MPLARPSPLSLLLTWAVLACGTARAQGLVEVGDGRFGVDSALAIVVARLPAGAPDSQRIESVSLGGETAALDTPAVGLTPARSYRVDFRGRDYVLYFTELPLLQISSAGPVVDEPKVPATFEYADADGAIAGHLGIELRGGLSITFPKKTYDLEFWRDPLGEENRDVVLAGLREDDDYILDALYNEPVRLRSDFAHALWLRIHTPYYAEASPRARAGAATAPVELFLDGTYRGVYAASEQVDRKQLRIDRETGTVLKVAYVGAASFDSAYETPPPNLLEWGGLELDYPDEPRADTWSRLTETIRFVADAPDTKFVAEVAEYFDLGNAVDFYIFLNVVRGLDNADKNIYYVQAAAGEPYVHVPWDLDVVMGSFSMLEPDPYPGGLLGSGLFDRLLSCPGMTFASRVRRRYRDLRTDLLHVDTLRADLARRYERLRGQRVYEREALVVPQLPNPDTGAAYLNWWLGARLEVLDGLFGDLEDVLSDTATTNPAGALAVFPNPVRHALSLASVDQGSDYRIVDLRGATVARGRMDTRYVDVSALSAGVYLIQVGGRWGRFVKA